MKHRINLREANQNLSRYVREAENGEEIIITRRGKPVARLVPAQGAVALSQEQVEARKRCLTRMRQGYPLGGKRIQRGDLHGRHSR